VFISIYERFAQEMSTATTTMMMMMVTVMVIGRGVEWSACQLSRSAAARRRHAFYRRHARRFEFSHGRRRLQTTH
jgi:hypothetical protein